VALSKRSEMTCCGFRYGIPSPLVNRQIDARLGLPTNAADCPRVFLIAASHEMRLLGGAAVRAAVRHSRSSALRPTSISVRGSGLVFGCALALFIPIIRYARRVLHSRRIELGGGFLGFFVWLVVVGRTGWFCLPWRIGHRTPT